jgi:iron(III) transport system ATP-binding protein
MGSNNRLPGRIAEVRGARARVAGTGWELWGRLQGDKRVGDGATAIVRLERVAVHTTPGDDRIAARLESSVYLGERWDSHFRLGDVRVRAWTREPPPEAPHFLGLPPESVWIF